MLKLSFNATLNEKNEKKYNTHCKIYFGYFGYGQFKKSNREFDYIEGTSGDCDCN